jgi:uncharacterized membrane protein YqaE (UPF0057 family)
MAELSDRRRYELETLAAKNQWVAILLGLFLSPLAYVYLGRWKWVLINVLTLNYFLLGFVLVPIHAYRLLNSAESKLN